MPQPASFCLRKAVIMCVLLGGFRRKSIGIFVPGRGFEEYKLIFYDAECVSWQRMFLEATLCGRITGIR